MLLKVFHCFLVFKNACGKAPCKNNAICQSGFTRKGYRCLCTSGFTGEDCEHDEEYIFIFISIFNIKFNIYI